MVAVLRLKTEFGWKLDLEWFRMKCQVPIRHSQFVIRVHFVQTLDSRTACLFQWKLSMGPGTGPGPCAMDFNGGGLLKWGYGC